MKIWDELHYGVKESTRTWLDWARRNAQELSDSGLRKIEWHDLMAERRRNEEKLGALVAERFILEGKKTVRCDAPGVHELIQRMRAIDDRLKALGDDQALETPLDQSHGESGEFGPQAKENLQEEKKFLKSDEKAVDAQ
ncbi:hypothetical protein SAMN05920897_11866 [Alkalispirochaeta americana]|uniref:Uncharacterized protein n=1 Tax=Alkalispirochaeta americana TaxID=159291 RepID=A0A1N6WSC7_9SPIO|nr:hypothetical protein [Alkalispirochaeta americana]SIQ92999.1 hypothetical protein SAMN05920897_11866 [Alkalispirochaeta americana]